MWWAQYVCAMQSGPPFTHLPRQITHRGSSLNRREVGLLAIFFGRIHRCAKRWKVTERYRWIVALESMWEQSMAPNIYLYICMCVCMGILLPIRHPRDNIFQ